MSNQGPSLREVRWELEAGADTEATPCRSAVYWLVPHGLFSLWSLRRCSADLPTGQSAEDIFSKFCPLIQKLAHASHTEGNAGVNYNVTSHTARLCSKAISTCMLLDNMR